MNATCFWLLTVLRHHNLMGDISIHIDGLKELDEKLASLPIETETKILGKALRTAAKPLLEELKKETPSVTDVLQHAETISSFRTDSGRGVSIGLTKYSSKNAYYGTWVNFGHKIGKRPGGKRLRVYPNDKRKNI